MRNKREQDLIEFHFVDVGRSKRNWSITLPERASVDRISQFLLDEIRNSHALRSDNPDIVFDFDTGEGAILAGAHCVGRIEAEGLFLGEDGNAHVWQGKSLQ